MSLFTENWRSIYLSLFTNHAFLLKRLVKLQTVFWIGMAGSILFYFVGLFLIPALLQRLLPSEVAIRQGIIVLVLIAVFTTGFLIVRNWLRRSTLSIRAALFLVIGALVLVMLFTALLGRLTGAPFVELLFLVYLIWLTRRTGHQQVDEFR